MNDQITQIFKKIFPTTHKSIAKLLENLTPVFQKTFKPKWRRGKKHVSLRKALAAIFYRTIESIEADIFVAMLAILSEKISKKSLKICFQSA